MIKAFSVLLLTTLVLAMAGTTVCCLGVAIAFLFAQFGVIKPWYVFSVAWVLLGFLIGLLRNAGRS